MDDRTLLELAAKAAGYKVRWHEPWGCFVHTVMINTTNPPTLAGQRHIWAPLDDDGDALRLSVALNIEYSLFDSEKRVNAGVWQISAKPWDCMTDYGNDKQAAVRRAIVRAAAEIGRAMA